uniref:Uncharacterized protein n=1 Tax=Lactuca sativa TaxID=4236 RepID=A0A9R1VDB6_LACSA|nr:hypothetical protein LSAT_V11C500287640 [Lactuca sativa]
MRYLFFKGEGAGAVAAHHTHASTKVAITTVANGGEQVLGGFCGARRGKYWCDGVGLGLWDGDGLPSPAIAVAIVMLFSRISVGNLEIGKNTNTNNHALISCSVSIIIFILNFDSCWYDHQVIVGVNKGPFCGNDMFSLSALAKARQPLIGGITSLSISLNW